MVANTILQQLGGHGFAVMTGSRNFISLGNGLQMSLQGTGLQPTG